MTRRYRVLQKDGLYYTQVRQFLVWMTMDSYGSKVRSLISDFASKTLEAAIKKAVEHENNIQVSEGLVKKAKTIWTWRSNDLATTGATESAQNPPTPSTITAQ